MISYFLLKLNFLLPTFSKSACYYAFDFLIRWNFDANGFVHKELLSRFFLEKIFNDNIPLIRDSIYFACFYLLFYYFNFV